MILEGGRGGGVCIEKAIPRGRGGVCIEKLIRGGGGGGGSELSDQLLDPDVPTLASQDKLKVSPKGLPFVNSVFGVDSTIPKMVYMDAHIHLQMFLIASAPPQTKRPNRECQSRGLGGWVGGAPSWQHNSREGRIDVDALLTPEPY